MKYIMLAVLSLVFVSGCASAPESFVEIQTVTDDVFAKNPKQSFQVRVTLFPNNRTVSVK